MSLVSHMMILVCKLVRVKKWIIQIVSNLFVLFFDSVYNHNDMPLFSLIMSFYHIKFWASFYHSLLFISILFFFSFLSDCHFSKCSLESPRYVQLHSTLQFIQPNTFVVSMKYIPKRVTFFTHCCLFIKTRSIEQNLGYTITEVKL